MYKHENRHAKKIRGALILQQQASLNRVEKTHSSRVIIKRVQHNDDIKVFKKNYVGSK